MNSWLRRRLARSELFSFNLVKRDQWIAAQAARIRPGTRVLDVGAGSCPYRNLFAHCEYRSHDLAPLRGDQLRHGGYGHLDYVSDLTAIPVADGSFGAVLCTEVLEHHPEPIAVVTELARILKPGGDLILTAPLGSGIHQEPYHYYGGYTPWWYERFLTRVGFENICVEPNEGSLRFFAQESIRFVREQLGSLPAGSIAAPPGTLSPDQLVVSLVEGWRGEICHVAITGPDGRFARYKVVDPSFHNWTGLALALRGQDISDFPVCNKSFNLSYCGFDL